MKDSPQVPKGYKQTEVGVIPADWDVMPLGRFLALRRGHDLTERNRRRGDVPVMGSAGLSGFHDTSLARGPGVVLGRSGASFGQAHYCREDFWPHNTALYVTDFFGNHPLFSFFFLRSIDFTRHNSGGAQQSLNRNFIAPILVAIPRRLEQEAIAEALSDAEAFIESLEQLLAKKCQVKQGAMQELLTGKKRLPGYGGGATSSRVTKFGPVPSDWVSTPLQAVAAFITKGSTPTTYGFDWQSDGVLFLRSECVSEHGLDLSQSMFVADAAHQSLRRSEVRSGDILMTITGNVGRVIHLAAGFGEANINQHIARIRIINDGVSDRFAFHFLSQPVVRHYYNLITTGLAYPQISLTQVRDTELPLPSFAEQTAIAAILSDMDTEITALEGKLAKARHLKQGMMQELLTGRTRLV